MAQQINLCSVVVAAERQSFSARTMAVAVLAFTVLGGALCASWVWNLRQAATGYEATLSDQARDIQGLRTALSEARASAAPLDAALKEQLQAKRADLQRQQQLLAGLQQGLALPGRGHSDRLQWIASTIPPEAWITGLRADGARLELSGLTLDPAVLNDWVVRMGASPLMQGLRLSGVQVESLSQPGGAALVPAAAQAAVGQRQAWAFRLVSSASAGGAGPEVRP